jgi:hypothetical protein
MPFDGNPRPYEPPTGAPFDQVLRDLQLARVKVATGWMRYRQQSGNRYCAYGAVISATRYDAHRTIAALRELRRAHPPCSLMRLFPAYALTFWNDHPRRTQREVVDLFDRAITQRTARATTVSESTYARSSRPSRS